MKEVNRKTWTYTAIGITFNIKEIVREVVGGINLPQDKDSWWAVVFRKARRSS
jgi:hypothetical protein